MLTCAILDDYQEAGLAMADWSRLGGRVETKVFRDPFPDAATAAAALQGVGIVVAMRERTPFDAALFRALPDLKLLVTTGMRNASIDLAAAAASGVTVCGTEGYATSTAELTWGLILAVMRQIPQEHDALRRGGRWQSSLGRDLNGLRLGIVGLGKLGGRVARYGRAFDMQVSAWSRSLTDARAAELGIERAATLDALLEAADVVSIHLVLTPQTRGLIGARELALMKPRAVLVNTSRGPIVDEAALLEALQSGRIGGAALDVFDTEPLPAGHPLRQAGNLIATPHLGYVTENTYRIFYGQAVEDIAAWLDGTPVRVLAAPG